MSERIVTPATLRDAFVATQVFVEVDGQELTAAEAVAALGTSFAVITACNPLSIAQTPAINAERNEALRQRLEALGAVVHPAFGRSPDGSWAERSFAATGILKRQARAEGKRFDQHAVFWITATHVTVVGCQSTWQRSRRHGDTLPQRAHGSVDDLSAAVFRALGARAESPLRRARSKGWVHLPGVGVDCPNCHHALEPFVRLTVDKNGVESRSTVFVCAYDATALPANRVPAVVRVAADARYEYALAKAEADALERRARTHWVYCIELDDGVGERSDDRPWIYVGQTSRTPEERFEQHRSGVKASRWVRKHGVRLCPDLYADQPVLRTEDESLAYERWLFCALAAAGWPVKGGT